MGVTQADQAIIEVGNDSVHGGYAKTGAILYKANIVEQ